MPLGEFAIDLKHVDKSYRNIHALRGVDIAVRRGEIFGLLGPNGAGKSTLVKIMMSVVRPTSADGTVLGKTVGDKATLAKVGYLPENHRFPRHLTGRQVLQFFGALSGVPAGERRSRCDQLLEQVDMTVAADRRVGTYSKGMMQRIGLAQAMINRPELIVLDEPTDGVDPLGRMQIRAVLKELRAGGTTVFINSHLLGELEHLCDRVAILLGGNVAAQGTMDELSAAQQRYEIELHEAEATAARLAPLSITWHPTTPTRGTFADGTRVDIVGPTLRIGTTDCAAIQPHLDQLRAAGIIIRRVQMVRPTLEELFVEAVTQRRSPPRLA